MARDVVRAEVVAQCLSDLRARHIHPQFAGYLCLKRLSARDGGRTKLRPNFKEFFDSFLRVPGGPVGKPYVLPFTESTPSPANLWMNKNVAGSYAPSSLRPVAPFNKVVSITGRANLSRYSLREEHWKFALRYLAYNEKIPVVALAVFLYRNYAVETENPTITDIVASFKDEFGYVNQPSAREEYFLMYTEESAASPAWLERIS